MGSPVASLKASSTSRVDIPGAYISVTRRSGIVAEVRIVRALGTELVAIEERVEAL
jgi:hypothetical protein